MKPLKYLLLPLFVLFALVAQMPLTKSASAADLSNFRAGRIIDDQVFFDPSGLTVSEIQAFLNAKVPSCDTDGRQQFGGTTRAAYGSSRGYPPPYTCIKNYLQQTTPKTADAYCQGYPAAYKTAAELIYGVSQSCGINPRVLIVLLQKEQGLITDDWPWSLQYRGATGYGCPDTAECDSEYYGFFNQVYHAARQFKLYAMKNSSYVYRAYRNNFIQWNPNASCGGSTVYIDNLATSGLYNYTPYQPNQAALGAGYGNGDGCSAYGNRNFWLYYSDWFGSTFKPNYRWQADSQTAFTDNTKSTAVDLNNIITGTRVYLSVRVKNDGVATWYKGAVNLATSQPNDRWSNLYDSTWQSRNRVAAFQETSVAPGQYATYDFWATIPPAGSYREYFNLVAEGITWMNDNGLYYQVNSLPVRYTWQPTNQKVYSDQARTQLTDTYQLKTGDRVYPRLQVTNTGNVPWYKGLINLATSQPKDRWSALHGGQWVSPNRVTSFNESVVKPGETATFDFSMQMPSVGYKKEYFNLVAEGITWMNDLGLYYDFTVQPDTYIWQPSSQKVFSDQTKSTEVTTTNSTPGKRYYLQVKVRNTGNTAWRKYSTNLAASQPKDRTSNFRDSSWLSTNRAATLLEDQVNPGEVGTFEFWVTSPTFSGERREYFNLVTEGVTWMNDLGLYYSFSN